MSIAAIKHSDCPTCTCTEPLSSLDETQSVKQHTFGGAREIAPEEREFIDKAFKELRMEFDKESKISRLQAANQQLLEALTLADAALSGANIDMRQLSKKVNAAITNAKQSQ